jgi:hypothetical protein
MKKTWRGLDVYPPIDDELKLVHTSQGEFTLASGRVLDANSNTTE